jgi:hypothetical protein
MANDDTTDLTATHTAAEVEGFNMFSFLPKAFETVRKQKDYDFSADTIEGDLIRPEGSPV